MNTRKSVHIVYDDTSFTYLKPISLEYPHMLLVVVEDAYGNVNCDMIEYRKILYDERITPTILKSILLELNVPIEEWSWVLEMENKAF